MMIQKIILIALFSFISLNAFANFEGSWQGPLSINGKTCQKTTIEIKQDKDTLMIFAALDKAGVHAVYCGTSGHKYYMELAETYTIKNTELWKREFKLGEMTEDKINTQDRFCNESGCHTVEYIKIRKLENNKIQIWVDFDGAIMTGQLIR